MQLGGELEDEPEGEMMLYQEEAEQHENFNPSGIGNLHVIIVIGTCLHTTHQVPLEWNLKIQIRKQRLPRTRLEYPFACLLPPTSYHHYRYFYTLLQSLSHAVDYYCCGGGAYHIQREDSNTHVHQQDDTSNHLGHVVAVLPRHNHAPAEPRVVLIERWIEHYHMGILRKVIGVAIMVVPSE